MLTHQVGITQEGRVTSIVITQEMEQFHVPVKQRLDLRDEIRVEAIREGRDEVLRDGSNVTTRPRDFPGKVLEHGVTVVKVL